MSRRIVIALLALAISAQAAVTFTAAPSSRVAAPGAEIVFEGTLTNTSATERVFLNDVSASIAPSMALKTNPFFANVPGILLPGESYTGPLFSMKLSIAAPPADYTGTITISGGSTITATGPLASTSFTVLATPISQWRYQTFGAAANDAPAGDFGDWDKDGMVNILEYALGTNAKAATAQPAATVAADHLTLSYSPAAPDVTYVVEGSPDLIQWSASNVEPVAPGPPGIVTYRYVQPISAGGAAFMRIRVSR
jgi:hypothetical protein